MYSFMLSEYQSVCKKERDEKIQSLWLACYTQEEIAEIVNCPRTTIVDIINKFVENCQMAKIGNNVLINHYLIENTPLFKPL